MDAFVLCSHGSVQCGVSRALGELAARVRGMRHAPIVEAGFLNTTGPTIEDALQRCAAAGATRAAIVPYFLVPGRFVTVELPRRLAAMGGLCPGLELRLAEPIGRHPAMAAAVLELAALARPIESGRGPVPDDPSLCQAEPACPLYGTDRCPAAPGRAAIHAPAIGASPPLPPPDAVVAVAHGSPLQTANAPYLQVLEDARASGPYGMVQAGYLEHDQPSVAGAIAACAAGGARTIAVVPYFLHPGVHVTRDLPALLAEASRVHPGVEIRMSPHAGASPHIAAAISDRAVLALRGAPAA